MKGSNQSKHSDQVNKVFSLMLTSRLNKTPPIGEPKATDIPEAAAADKTSLLRAREPY